MAVASRSRKLAMLLGVLVMAAPPGSSANDAADFTLDFTTPKPGKPSDLALHILYKDAEHPNDPESRPPALTYVRIAAPRGTLLNGAAVPACHARNPELMLLGGRACPAESNLGGGFASVLFEAGPPQPQVAEVTLFNYGDGLIELLEFLGGGLKVVDRAAFTGTNKMVLHPAVVPGVTEREFAFTYVGQPAYASTPFVTTPAHCPRSGRWTSRLTYRVTTGETYRVRSRQRCRR